MMKREKNQIHLSQNISESLKYPILQFNIVECFLILKWEILWARFQACVNWYCATEVILHKLRLCSHNKTTETTIVVITVWKPIHMVYTAPI